MLRDPQDTEALSLEGEGFWLPTQVRRGRALGCGTVLSDPSRPFDSGLAALDSAGHSKSSVNTVRTR